MDQNSVRTCRVYAGFTLLEMSIVILIGSLFFASALQIMKINEQRRGLDITHDNLQKAASALKSYLHLNHNYPCPAQREIKRGEPGFGKALDSCYFRQDASSGDGVNPSFTTASAVGRNNKGVIIGVLPFRSLGIHDSDALDGWGHMLQYAVTEQLTNPASFNQNDGAIDVVDEKGVSRVAPAGSVQFVVYSTGADGVGAISSAGGVISPCRQGLLETENCNDDARFMDAPSPLFKTETEGMKVKQVTDYDDYILYKQFDNDFNPGWGLVLSFIGACPQGFTAIPLGNRQSQDTLYISPSPVSKAAPRGAIPATSVCYTPYYSTTLFLSNVVGSNGAVQPCPPGWTSIGYETSATAGSAYQVCAR